jgi:hypothetical protein
MTNTNVPTAPQATEINNIPTENNNQIVDKITPSSKSIDVGTMNLVASYLDETGSVESKLLRNVFLSVDKELVGTSDLSKINHVVLDDEIYILSEDAYRFCNIFGQEVERPMKRGMINPDNMDAIDILTILVKELIGTGDGSTTCCYSIPANPIDNPEMNVTFHKEVFKRIICSLGYKAVPINEAFAIILSECQDTNFTGIGMSFGSGMCNCSLAYKGISLLEFSVARGGDFIDENAAVATGSIPNRVNAIKEKGQFSLTDLTFKGNKKERRIKEAIVHYYRSLIDYIIKHFVEKLNDIDVEIDEVPIILSGGTSLANGFVDLFKQQIEEVELPFDISDIRLAQKPLYAVSQGLLIKALQLDQNK